MDYRTKIQALEESDNPFATIVLAHLAFMKTKGRPHVRFDMKWSIFRPLYEKGYDKSYVLNIVKVLDWILVLPKKLAVKFKIKLDEFEEDQKVAYITSFE